MRLPIALSILFVCSPAMAQVQGDQPLPDVPMEGERSSRFEDTLDQADRERPLQRDENRREARVAIESYGRCTAQREPGEANRLLTMDFNTASYRTGLRMLAKEAERHCARDSFGRGVMRSAGLLFSGAVAEALLEAGATPLNIRLARNSAAKATSYSPTDAVALCVARSVPDQVAALFATEPGTEAETAAAAPLERASQTCAQAVGISSKLQLTVPALRAMIATAAYRLLANSGDANA